MNGSHAIVSGAVLVAILPALLLPACARPHTPTSSAARPARLVWPAPPERQRFELVQVFERPSDLGLRRPWWRRLTDMVTGGHETQLVRPASVAVAGNRIVVADAGAALVHVYDLGRERFTALQACGEVSLREPVGVAVLDDRLYVSDAGAARIDVFDFDGNCAGGWKVAAGSRPGGLAVDAARGRLYMADPGAHQVIVFDPNGATVARFGRRGTGPGEFNFPGWLALDGLGRLYVSDALNFRIQIFTPDGTSISSFGHHGDGSGDFARPKGVGIDRDGHVYVVDALFDAVQIFDTEGRYLLGFGTRGVQPGQFWLPSGLTISGDRIYVADSYNRRVQVFRYLGGDG